MATTYKILGQVAPSATTTSTLYTVPGATSSVCSTLSICNRGAATTFRVSTRPTAESLANKHYMIYDSSINQNDTVFLTLGMTLAASDMVEVYAGTGNLSFGLFGSEIS